MFEGVDVLFNKFEELDLLITKCEVVWVSNGEKLTFDDYNKFKTEYYKNPIDYIFEGMDFPVSEKLYINNKNNDYWLP